MTSIIHSLETLVTPQVLELVKDYTGNNNKKSELLNAIYRLVAVKLSDKAVFERVNGLNGRDESAINLFDALFKDEIAEIAETKVEEKETFLGKLYHAFSEQFDLPVATVSAVFLATLPLIYHYLKGLAGEKSLPDYLEGEREGLLSGLPCWLGALPFLGFLGGASKLADCQEQKTTKNTVTAPINPLVDNTPAESNSAVLAGVAAATGVAGVVGGMASGAISGASNAINGTVNAVSDVAGGVVDGVTGAVGSVANTASNAVSSATNIASDAVSGVAGAVGSVASGVTNTASGVIGGVTGAVSGAVGGVTGAVTNAVNSANGTNDASPAPVTSTTHQNNEQKEGGFLKGLLPIIGLIILGGLAWLMLKSCQKQPTPVATPVAEVAKPDAVALSPASVGIKLNGAGDALASCTADVGTLTFGEKVRAGIAKTFGADSCQLNEVKDTDVQMPAEQYLPQILGFMKGVPDASLKATGKTITLGSSDPVALEKLIGDVKTALPSDFEVVADEGSAPSTSTAPSPTTLAPATLSLALNDKGDVIANCESKVGTGLGDKVRSLIAGVFGAEKCNFAEDAGTDTNLAVEPHLAKVLELMKGVPNATLSLDGNKLTFGSSDPKALEKLLADVKGVVGSDFEVQGALSEAETVAKAIEESSKAIDSLSKDASPEELVKALNLQIINFATSSNEIPDANKAILDKAAVIMKDLPNAQLVITGHTDNRGAVDMNQKLSERRAKAVHDYLVSKGVDDAKLEVKGVGPAEPVATNDTPEGRFKNRRIEFKLMNNGETVADTNKSSGK